MTPTTRKHANPWRLREAARSVTGTLYRTPLACAHADHIPETLTELRKAPKSSSSPYTNGVCRFVDEVTW